MKKKYFEPQIDVVTIETRGIICTSGLGIADETTTGAGITTADGREFDMEEDDFDMGDESEDEL